MKTLREKLQLETAECHAALDKRLCAPSVASMHGLARYLMMQKTALTALSPCFAADQELSGAGRLALAQIEADLATLRFQVPADTLKPPVSGGMPDRLGRSYVIGGGSMGMRLLHRHAIASDCAPVRSACIFLGGNALVPFWRWILHGCRTAAPDVHDTAIQAARNTFELYAMALDSVDTLLKDKAA